ncbi:DUF2786 domain-containing protein [Nocardiopsis ansamitocini]|uniref:DUF2786 domain-containing protein n=1 Tax=Nocardiopsis ansamitocini TaxID=1670832 RepID=A0A9W6P616_9ACTN|nr:DUF2786 domain-containing protein [Nocardiopsis ansamitocini]GLU48089.1 hypothetical protein Nans01_24400 [Nocardiopsis ansamitocini]
MTESPPDTAERLIGEAVLALSREDGAAFERAADRVAAGPGTADWQGTAEAVLAESLRRYVAAAWRRGWQPTDLVHYVRRRFGDQHAVVVVDAIAAELADYPAETVHERWRAQLQELGGPEVRVPGADRLRLWRTGEGLVWPVAVLCLLETVALLALLPELPQLCPPPGRARPAVVPATTGTRGRAGRRMLDRVRALLAKAESTEFPEEAETLSARAQELMARHGIDVALLDEVPGAPSAPVGIRVPVEGPYEASKATLLEVVATANHCRTVWHSDLGFSTVLGFGAELEAVELLHTSLLAQATTAMVRAGSGPPGRGKKARARTKEFRQSFLAAYVQRVSERLENIAHATERAAAQQGEPDLLPVLAARDVAVEEAVEAMFPGLVRTRTRAVGDYDGWVSGLAEADRAPLRARHQVHDGPGDG